MWAGLNQETNGGEPAAADWLLSSVNELGAPRRSAQRREIDLKCNSSFFFIYKESTGWLLKGGWRRKVATSELNGPSTGSDAELNRTSRHIWVANFGRKLRPLGI